MRTVRVQPLKVHLLTSIQNYLAQYLVKVKKKDIESAVFSTNQEDFYYE